jgi:acyl-CoA thioesterase I
VTHTSFIKSNLLYPLLLSGVLLLSSCSENRQETEGNEDAVVAESAVITNSDQPEGDDSELNVRILFLGDSVAAGFGVEPEEAFPALIQQKIDSLEYPALSINAGLSGETTSGGLSRVQWLLRERVDILFLELGGNDGLRGINLDLTENNITRIIELTREKYPGARVLLAGMQIPPNLGHEYTAAFEEMYPRIAEKFDAVLVPFAPDGLGELGDLLQGDGIHPNVEGHKLLALQVWRALEPVVLQFRPDGPG